MRIGIKSKILIIMVAVGFLPGMAGMLSVYSKGIEVFQQSMGQDLVYITHQIALNIRTTISKEASEGKLMSQHPGVRFLVQSTKEEQVWFLESVKDYIYLDIQYKPHATRYLYDADGHLILQVGPDTPMPDATHSPASIFKAPSVNSIVGSPIIGNRHQGYYIPIHTPIRGDKGGEVIGSISTLLHVPQLLSDIQADSLEETGHLNLVSASGTLIFDPLLPNGGISFTKETMERIATSNDSWFIAQDEHQVESVLTVAPLKFKPQQGLNFEGEEPLYIVFTKPTVDAFEAPIQSVLVGAALPGFFFAGLLILVIYLTLRRIVDPIAILKKGATIIGGGNLDHNIEIHTADEIEDLANEFNKMTRELKASYSDLEKKVSERTLELEASYKELEKASSLKSQFIASMSHELRTPLNAIMGFSDVLTEEVYGEINDKQRRYLQNIHKSGKHLLEVINDILDLTKIEAGKMSLHPRELVVEDAMTEIHSLVTQLASDAGVELHFDVSRAPSLIIADCVRFRQIMYNLLSNAIKFTPEGGQVTVTAEQEGELLTVSVSDTGIGIADEHCKTIFMAFRQVDSSSSRSYEGTGLGLALCKEFIELHGGSISLTSTLGKGSTFKFSIPIMGPPPSS